MKDTSLTYDRRQYYLMLDRLVAFEQERLALGGLISDIEGLLSVLQNAKGPWMQSARKKWAVLEEVYASALDKNYATLPDTYQTLVDTTVRDLKGLVESQLVDCKDEDQS